MLCLDRSVVSFTLCLPATYSADLRRPVPTDRAAMDGQACCKLHLLHLGLPHNPHQYQHLFRISLLIYHRPYNHHLISLLHHNHFLQHHYCLLWFVLSVLLLLLMHGYHIFLVAVRCVCFHGSRLHAGGGLLFVLYFYLFYSLRLSLLFSLLLFFNCVIFIF